jgi:hypothetical protein
VSGARRDAHLVPAVRRRGAALGLAMFALLEGTVPALCTIAPPSAGS